MLLLALGLGGCSTGEGGGGAEGDALTVYVSSPLRGASGTYGHAIREGARLALEDAGGGAGGVEIGMVSLDDTGGRGAAARWSPGAVAENAREATSDSGAIAYLGEFESGATRVSLPVTNEARMVQVSPASTALDLVSPLPGSDEVPDLLQPSGERSFGRVIPDDEVQAGAGAVWAKRLGARRIAIMTDGSEFGEVAGDEFAEEAEGLGISVAATGRATEGGLRSVRRSRPDLLYYGGTAGEALPFLTHAAREAPSATIMGTDALLLDGSFLGRARPFESRLRLTASAQDPSQLPRPEGQRFVRRYRKEYGHEPDPYAAYGHEGMAVLIDSVARAGDGIDRTEVIGAFLDTTDRRSVLGTYSIDEVGNTTLDRIAGYRISDGRPVFDEPLRAP
jgi:branched-chain amino acid transport system substrate-binding protein